MSYIVAFSNRSGLPVMVETWQQVIYGLNTMRSQRVAAGETVQLHSVTGEWYLNCMFDDMNDVKKWRDCGLYDVSIGKFSNEQYIDGKYGCMDCDDFDIRCDWGVIVFIPKDMS